jgi:hypothetical protein
MAEPLADRVRQRAHHVCEYCRIPQAYYPTVPFPIDHIIGKQHKGRYILSNLANSCLHCNSHKGPNIAGIDPVSGKLTKLFHPRRHKWERHFRWEGARLVGRTAVGRVTIAVLAMNDPEAVKVRQALIDEGLFTPTLLNEPGSGPPSG